MLKLTLNERGAIVDYTFKSDIEMLIVNEDYETAERRIEKL